MLSGSLRRRGGDPEPALRILIIEDDASLLKLYRRQISLWPFSTVVNTAPNGFEGLLKIGEVLPQMLLCDLRLPGVNGFQIVRALCDIERYRNMKIVVVSALPTEEIVAHGGIPERVELMGKPIDFKRLYEVAARIFTENAALQPRSRLRIY
jgi:DNA-binding response OmpR family regulator